MTARTHRSLLTLAACIVAAVAVRAAATEMSTVVIHIVLPQHLKQAVTVTASATSRASTHQTSADVFGTGDVTINLEQGTWTIKVESDGLWADEQTVSGSQALTVAMVPAGMIRAQIGRPETATSITVELLDERGRVDHQARCPSADHILHCVVPAGNWDVRLRMASYSPTYIGNVKVPAKSEANLGVVVFRDGGSMVGRVETPDARPAEGTIVHLKSGDATADRHKSFDAIVNSKGYFRFAGIDPGVYTLLVSAKGFAPVSVNRVEIRPGLETRLRDDLRLSEPVALSLTVKPPLDPYGRPWRIQLMRSASGAVGAGGYWEHEGEKGGSWRQEGLATGDYTIVVGDSGGNRWFEDRFTLAETTERPVEIKTIRIEGSVTQANSPAVGTIFFGGKSGIRSVQITTDDSGNFEGALPQEGIWPVEFERQDGRGVLLKPVDVRVSEERGAAVLQLQLPSGTLAGTVVDSSGSAVSAATVQVLTTAGPLTSRSSDDGKFSFDAVGAGDIDIVASKDDRTSRLVHVTVAEAQNVTDVHLILERDRTIRGRVLAPWGPIAGANVAVWPSQAGGFVEGAISGADGYFVCNLPTGATSLNTAVYAVGFGIVFHEQSVTP